MSYSQNEEENYILNFADKTGRFLDIGTWKSCELSNTRALYERGWYGVMVEPSPGPMRELVEELGTIERIILLQAAIANVRSIIPFWVTDGPYTTSSAGVMAEWASETDYKGKIYVPTVTFEDLTNQFGPFNFVNIDAEGASPDLFFAMFHANLEPGIICVEHDGRLVEIQGMASRKGYKVVYTNDINVVMIR